MNTEKMITELNAVVEKNKNDFVPTFKINIAAMCRDIIPKLEQLAKYEGFGTVEECRKAMEKQKAKKAINDTAFGMCPNCHNEFNSELVNEYNMKYCIYCGHAIDRRESL